MNKRNVATVLWFLMGWTVGSVLAVMFNLPSYIGIVMGFPFAAAVRYGPLGRLWSEAPPRSSVRPADEVAEALDRKAAGSAPATGEQHTTT
jgi:hypothetical protein